ncbi:MAG: CoA transferase [Chloroflexi bacterium]|nr:CoA transferase [Chloroflexota bacterium]
MSMIYEGVRILDFSQGMAGSLATMLFADNGAEVIKVEPPEGDPFRHLPAWLMWNRGKKGIVLDLDTEAGRTAAVDLAASSDAVLESFVPGEADALGIGYDTLSQANPGLVYCSITALGSKGAWRHLKPYDGVVQAKGGGYARAAIELAREDPTYRVRPNGSYGAANLAVQAITAALRVRRLTGKGQRVETSLFQGYTCYDSASAMRHQAAKGLLDPPLEFAPLGGARKIHFPYMVVRCKDGRWLQMANMAARLFPNWMHAIGLGHIYDDPRFKGAPNSFPRDEDGEELRRVVVERMLERTLDEWMAIFRERDVIADEFLTTQQFMDHPQTVHNEGVVRIDDPQVGWTEQIGPLVRFSRTPSKIGVPAPTLGQHTSVVLSTLSERSRPTNGAVAKEKHLSQPLEGLTILDFSTWLAAPLGTWLLAGLGARVIKIEPPGGDEFRAFSQGRGATFQGKESVVIDLKTKDGQAIVHKLIGRADALMHNMRGSAPERVGIDYDTVRKINPSIIYHYAGSYGSTGPGAGRGAFHPIGGALSGGALWQLGQGNGPPPPDVPLSPQELYDYGNTMRMANEGSPDVTSAIAVGTALAMALFEKERTGKGQYIETSMLLSNGYICSSDFVRYAGKPPRMEPDRALRGLHALHRLYRAAEGWVFLDLQTDQDWQAFVQAMGRDDRIAGDRFGDRERRQRYDNELTAHISQILVQRTADEWEAELTPKGVSCIRADAQEYEEFFLSDPSLRENNIVVKAHRPSMGTMYRQGPPANFSLTPGSAELAHAFGEDTRAVLSELGYSHSEMEDLHARGIVKWHTMETPIAG